jgi:archaellum biogenesis protein FlaJ (TadC family)
MTTLLAPLSTVNRRYLAFLVVLLLAASGMLVLAAAAAMPEPYSWRTHSISESAAQGLLKAWIARFSFLCFGAAVLILCIVKRREWARASYWMHLVFAVCMLATAAFSHKPWLPGVAVDEFEDLLHSITASAMGFAFCFGVVARWLQRGRTQLANRAFDVIALLVATAMSPVAVAFPSNGGLVQRLMFAVAYAWFATEALASAGVAVRST